MLSRISAKHGIFGVLGNHDSAEMAIALEQMGVRMLVNDAAEIRQRNAAVWLVGVDDPFDYGCDDLAGALASVPPAAFKNLLAHAPEMYREAADRGTHLYLCGHTHAGQIRFPVIGSLRHNASCPKPLSYGLWAYKEMRGYTTAGAGSSMLPIRFNCPPEVALIELRAAG
jgi:predicted MPP superfamily phosphohydrolase